MRALVNLVAPLIIASSVLAEDLPPPETDAITRHPIADIASEAALSSAPLLRGLLSLPNDAHFPDQIEKNILWLTLQFKKRGFDVRRVETEGLPLLLASKHVDPDAQTTLIYLQADGQPTDPEKWDQASPFTPVFKAPTPDGWEKKPWPSAASGPLPDADWRVFARSASDAKGPIVMLIAALDAMEQQGLRPTTNLKLVMDFEEELGSPNLPLAVDQNRDLFDADLLLIFDGPRHLSNQPTLFFGARGIARITLKSFGAKAPQHSGTFGNYAPNPAQDMAILLASMKDQHGRVLIGGFQDGIVISDTEMKALREVPDNEQAMLEHLGVKSPERVASTYQEAMQYPSLTLLGIESGWTGKQTRTIVPATATAELDIRLVPEKDPEALIHLLREHIQAQGFHIIAGSVPTENERKTYDRLIAFEHRISYGAFRTALDSKAAIWAIRAMTKAFGHAPVQIRIVGGSIPISPFVNALDIPAIGVPTVYLENNQHSPNENLRWGNYVEGIQTFFSLLTEESDPR
ncbi:MULTISPECIES: M20/M25/M40 family metallo-hydrolase [Kordiimonas]|jgi:acetylornithine deacetylase/succinyl-diaminopimelate desuccinylase-like protein|uniref:M20/M25/M40 family metallo-hydrolase n=1 Tax=Kordiimonas TaxID=288021 RepID=UPI00257D2C13|nr:M20/M25/M40 family metallo-hydrolase [Kordiimonas sp. UBA4487]